MKRGLILGIFILSLVLSMSFAYAETWSNPGNEVVYTNGKVGIGTSSAIRSLHIKGEPIIRFENSAYGNSLWEIQAADSFNIPGVFGIVRYDSGSAVKSKSLFITKEGNVGIGSEPGTYKLFVDGNLRALNLNVADIDSNNIRVSQGANIAGSLAVGGGLRSASINTGDIDSNNIRVGQGLNVLGEATFGKSVAIAANLRALNLNVADIDSNNIKAKTATFSGDVSVSGKVLVKKVCFEDGSCLDSSSIK